jgi:hypothetical protein
MSSGESHHLTARDLTKLRLQFLGRNPTDAEIDAPGEAAHSRDELHHLGASNDLTELLASWSASDEFVYRWTRNPLFAAAQGLDALGAVDNTIRPLIHVHVPKTAGTSLNESIAAHLSPLQSFSQRPLAELLALPLARLMSFRFISGHFGFSVADLVRFRNPILFSMARNPLEHYPSMWRYFIREGVIDASSSLEDWLTSAPGLRNSQTRSLTSNLLARGPVDFELHGWIIDVVNSDEMLDEMLRPAVERLDYLAPSDNVAELYKLLHHAAELPGVPIEIVPRLNATERIEISAVATEIILEMSQVDAEYFRLACSRWSEVSSQP